MQIRTYVGIALVGLSLAARITAANAAPVDNAIKALYAANNAVQRAVDFDACKNGDMLQESKTARARLSRRNVKAYDAIADLMGKAYDAAPEPTDSALEAILSTFCEASSNR